jgi:Eukaryotic cytochrome b561
VPTRLVVLSSGTADSTGYIYGRLQGKEMRHRMQNMFPLPVLSKGVALVAGILVLLLLVIPASAHPPSDIVLSYQPGDLTATITHNVANTSTHYVYRVTILIDGAPANTVLYTSQPSVDQFTYHYPVNAAPGDTITVTADCNIAGSITRTLVVGEDQEQEGGSTPFWPYHALLMTLGFILLIAAVLLVQFGKTIQGWYRWHKHLALIGSVLIVVGLAIAYYMVGLSGGPHIRVGHAVIGITTIALLVLSISFGYAKEKVRPPKLYLRTIHFALGIITILFLIATIFSVDV